MFEPELPMITRDDLTAAVTDGLLSKAQAAGLIARAESRAGVVDADDERFRFLNGFNDVFLALGITLIAAAFVSFIFFVGNGWVVVVAAAIVVMWGLAEIVIRRYRAVLPAIFISLAISMFAALLLGEIFSTAASGRNVIDHFSHLGMAAAFSLLAFVIVFYWRFRLPFTLGTIGGLGYTCAFLVVAHFAGAKTAAAWGQIITLCSGLALFAAAVAYDFSDSRRLTRRSDCAFWLHIVAAPMITHGLLAPFATRLDMAAVLVILAGFAFFAVASLALDRRAPLVSILVYLGIAIGYVFAAVTMKSALTIGATLMVLGIIVVTMGLAWRPLRRMLLSPFARFAFVGKLPPLHPA
jgi:hypothetical protein